MQYLKSIALIAAYVTAGLMVAAPAHASLILNIQSVSYAPGSNGDSLDVTLTNTGTSAVGVASFQFDISTTNTSINFVDATDLTTLAGYIFPNAVSFDYQFTGTTDILPNGANSNSGQNFASDIPSDLDVNGTNISIGAGATVGLGHVIFNIASNATTGPATITFDQANTILDTFNGTTDVPLTITTFNSGTVTVGAATPEPAVFGPALLGLACLWIGRKRFASR